MIEVTVVGIEISLIPHPENASVSTVLMLLPHEIVVNDFALLKAYSPIEEILVSIVKSMICSIT